MAGENLLRDRAASLAVLARRFLAGPGMPAVQAGAVLLPPPRGVGRLFHEMSAAENARAAAFRPRLATNERKALQTQTARMGCNTSAAPAPAALISTDFLGCRSVGRRLVTHKPRCCSAQIGIPGSRSRVRGRENARRHENTTEDARSNGERFSFSPQFLERI